MKLVLFFCALLLAACRHPDVAVNPRANFGAVKRVAVASFAGPQGDLAADLMTQNLLRHGADVVERSQLAPILQERKLVSQGVIDKAALKRVGKLLGVDALFIGTVASSREPHSYIVTASRANRHTRVTPIDGRNVVPEGPVFGVSDSQVVTTEAQASIVARMVDVNTGSVLWSASMTYEGFDVQSAMNGISDSFVTSLIPVWPVLHK
jgi:curli biogenesis system outer membrane secretion channel CsgG